MIIETRYFFFACTRGFAALLGTGIAAYVGWRNRRAAQKVFAQIQEARSTRLASVTELGNAERA